MSSVADFDNEPDDVPPAPSRPANETRINGLPGDTWALMIERKIDALFEAQRQALSALAEAVAVSNKKTDEGFDRIFEALKAIERHEVMLRNQQQDINALDGKVGALRDRMDAVERQIATKKRRKAGKR